MEVEYRSGVQRLRGAALGVLDFRVPPWGEGAARIYSKQTYWGDSISTGASSIGPSEGASKALQPSPSCRHPHTVASARLSWRVHKGGRGGRRGRKTRAHTGCPIESTSQS